MPPNYFCEITKRSYTQSQIDTRLSRTYAQKHEEDQFCICEGCGRRAQDNSHTISQKSCKHLHKVCLIWDIDNLKDLCRECHLKWEAGGEKAMELFCYESCMEYVEIHDPIGYQKRLNL